MSTASSANPDPVSRSIPPHKVNLITLGCSKNLVDSEVLMGHLSHNNIELMHDVDEAADTVIINTCGFIVDAKQESIDTILQFAQAKNRGEVKQLLVMGCLSERYKEDLKKEIPEVDAFYGVSDLPEIICQLGFDYRKDLIGERLLTTPSHYAYLKIAEGCNRKCSFCAIPAIRGKHISRKIEDILKEAEMLAAKGVKEVILISQDLSYYGMDLYGKHMLPELVESLAQISKIEWIRLHYLYPTGFPKSLFSLMRENKKVCNYIDIPLQHISSKILKSMKRGVDGPGTRELIGEIRKELPGVAIRTAFIVGYPGETEKAYEELKDFIIESKFERMGLFAYSPEEGTSAYPLKSRLSKKKVQQRIDDLMKIQENISFELNQKRIGKNLMVLIDRKEGEFYIGRTEYDSPEVDNEVLVRSDSPLNFGQFYQVDITGADHFDLFGKVTP